MDVARLDVAGGRQDANGLVEAARDAQRHVANAAGNGDVRLDAGEQLAQFLPEAGSGAGEAVNHAFDAVRVLAVTRAFLLEPHLRHVVREFFSVLLEFLGVSLGFRFHLLVALLVAEEEIFAVRLLHIQPPVGETAADSEAASVALRGIGVAADAQNAVLNAADGRLRAFHILKADMYVSVRRFLQMHVVAHHRHFDAPNIRRMESEIRLLAVSIAIDRHFRALRRFFRFGRFRLLRVLADDILHTLQALDDGGNRVIVAQPAGRHVLIALLAVAHRLVVERLHLVRHFHILKEQIHNPLDRFVTHSAVPPDSPDLRSAAAAG